MHVNTILVTAMVGLGVHAGRWLDTCEHSMVARAQSWWDSNMLRADEVHHNYSVTHPSAMRLARRPAANSMLGFINICCRCVLTRLQKDTASAASRTGKHCAAWQKISTDVLKDVRGELSWATASELSVSDHSELGSDAS